MVAWDDLRSYLVSDYDAIERSPRLVELKITFDGEAPVTTYVSSALGHNDDLWVSIDALVGDLSGIDAVSGLRAIGDMLCGGLAHMPIQDTDYLVVRHGMPMENLPPDRINDFLVPMYATANASLRMKQHFGIAAPAAGFNQL